MGLMAQIKDDIQQITTNINDFATAILFTPPTGPAKTCNGIGVKHNLKFDDFGNPVSSKTARITVSEPALVAAGYTVRNAGHEVALIGHKVNWTDVMGIVWSYKVKENIAGETNGIIVLILADFTT